MNDNTNNGDKTLTVPSKTLTLKRPVEQGVVRQSFSHGRTKQVVVETVKRRLHVPGEAKPVAAAPTPAPVAPPKPQAQKPYAQQQRQQSSHRTTGVVLPTLTEAQRDARERALSESRAREEEDRRRQEAEAKIRAEREAREKAEREEAEARKREEEARRAQELEAKRKIEEEAKRRLSGGAPAPAPVKPAQPAGGAQQPPRRPLTPLSTPVPSVNTARRAGEVEEDNMKKAVIRRPGVLTKVVVPPKAPSTRETEQKQRGRLTLANITSEDEERTRSVAAFRRRTQRLKGHQVSEPKEKSPVKSSCLKPSPFRNWPTACRNARLT